MFSELQELLTSELIFSIKLTCAGCISAAALFVLIGLPAALWLSRSHTLLSKAAAFIITLPLVFPPIAMGYILLLLLGRNGIIGAPLEQWFGAKIIFTKSAVALGAFIAGLPMFVRPIEAVFQSDEIRCYEEAARGLGASAAKTFFAVTIPLAKRSIISGLLIAVARASGEVGITMMIGGNIAGRTNTLSLEIFNCVSRGDFDEATLLCFILSIVSLAIYVLLDRLKDVK